MMYTYKELFYYLHCPRLLWFHLNEPHRLKKGDTMLRPYNQHELLLDTAAGMFPGAVRMKPGLSPAKAADKTAREIARSVPVLRGVAHAGEYQAAFDILVPQTPKYLRLISLSQAINKKALEYAPLAFQFYILKQCGYYVTSVEIFYLNRNYVRRGALDPDALFKKIDVTAEIVRRGENLKKTLKKLSSVSRQKDPAAPFPASQCSKIHFCNLKESCHKPFAANSIYNLISGREIAGQMLKKGITTIEKIPDDVRLNRVQSIQRRAFIKNGEIIDKPKIMKFLAQLEFPLHILDFEAFQTPLPLWDHIHPYQRLLFQYSLHILVKPGDKPLHFSLVCKPGRDPRPELMASLKKNILDRGSILAYNTDFEKKQLKECRDELPEYREWVASLLPRFVDFQIPFRDAYFYHPSQKTKTSLKAILPVFTGKSYKDLEIGEGYYASTRYLDIVTGKVSRKERKQTIEGLKEYCGLDTMAIVEIYRELRRMIGLD